MPSPALITQCRIPAGCSSFQSFYYITNGKGGPISNMKMIAIYNSNQNFNIFCITYLFNQSPKTNLVSIFTNSNNIHEKPGYFVPTLSQFLTLVRVFTAKNNRIFFLIIMIVHFIKFANAL